MNLVLANSSGKLDRQVGKIEKVFSEAEKVCAQQLGLTKVDVVAVCDPGNSMIIPEINIGGMAANQHLLYLIFNGKNFANREMYATLCHELHHARRYEGPGFGGTLFTSIIAEGLATHFEGSLAPETILPKTVRESNEFEKILGELKPHFPLKKWNYRDWFVQDPSGRLPRWAGYIVGYHIVDKYASKTGKTAAELVLEPAETFKSVF